MKTNYDKNLYYKSSIFYSIPDVKEITKPLKKIGVNYFSYLEFFQTGEFRCLINEESIPTSYVENNGLVLDPLLLSRTLIPTGFYLSTNYYLNQGEELLNFWKYTFQEIGYPKSFLFVPDNQNNDMKRVYCFATTDCDFFHQGLAEAFVPYFHDKAKSLIQHADKRPLPNISKETSPIAANIIERICVPKQHSQIRELLKGIDFNKYKCFKFGQINKLSTEEVQCLYFTIQGKPAREIACLLGFSQKTIEFHLGRLKSKLNCRSKIELLAEVLTSDVWNNPLNL